jgi:hypothetical protein
VRDVWAQTKATGGEKTALFAPFMYKMHYFTKTGSGQTWGKLKKSAVFSQAMLRAARCGENVNGFYCPLLQIKMTILPRQARDKYREGSSRKSTDRVSRRGRLRCWRRAIASC